MKTTVTHSRKRLSLALALLMAIMVFPFSGMAASVPLPIIDEVNGIDDDLFVPPPIHFILDYGRRDVITQGVTFLESNDNRYCS